MKNLISIILLTLFVSNTNSVTAQKAIKKDTVIIKTSTECNMCKERIEKEMAYTKGIISSTLNVEKAEFTVIYKPHKTTPENIRLAISKIGYDADDVKANMKAYNSLPNCCQKGGMDH